MVRATVDGNRFTGSVSFAGTATPVTGTRR